MAMLKQLTINLPLVEALEKMPRSLVQKKADLGAFIILCTIGPLDFTKALYGLGASINLMPLVVYNKLGLEDPSPTNMRLVMADRSVKWPVGIFYDVLVKVASFIFPADLTIINCEVDFERANELLFRLNDEVVRFDICQSMKQHNDMSVFFILDVYYEEEHEVPIEEKFVVETLAVVLMNFDQDGIEDYE
ncbi:uncharacterized protein LOC124888936 [Capsicum annuum]|uniref:uncharacterized protein LOC124888936 n=1 Tax=Capsicum annuum TaxID=4072 RepID=UPI001FB166DF|nr:uncharacterized protein LOC124888936 [Capsicum annuum]